MNHPQASTKLQIDTALSAAEGLKLIRQHSYQLLLIDHMMPEMDGIEMLQHVKTMDGGIYKDIPAVAITANALSGAKQTYLDAGFCGYLSKPIDPERFEQIIKDNLPQEYVTECEDGNGDTATEGQETDGTSDPKQAEEWSIPGIDIAKALSYIGGSRELYISLLQTYLDGSEERIRKLEECKNKEDIFNYDITIHGLKGISASIGADSMAVAAAGLEEACKDPQTAMTCAVLWFTEFKICNKQQTDQQYQRMKAEHEFPLAKHRLKYCQKWQKHSHRCDRKSLIIFTFFLCLILSDFLRNIKPCQTDKACQHIE